MKNTQPNSIHNPFYSKDIKKPVDENWAAKRRLGDSLRQLTADLVTCTSSTDELDSITKNILAASSILQSSPAICGRTAYEKNTAYDYGSMSSIGYELNPLDGCANPIASPMKTWINEDEACAYGETIMGWQYEGPTNCVHGGFVAAIFDQFLGIAQKLTGQPGVTGTLKIRYIKPTPLNTPLKLTGRVKSVQGRKNVLVGEMWANEVLTASCEGLFITIDPQMYKDLQNNS